MVCPNLNFCPAKVTFQHYKEICLSETQWKNCKFYADYEMTPSQWKKLSEDIDISTRRLF